MNGYNNAHMRVRRARGPAKTYQCRCGDQARDWAYIGSESEYVNERGWRYSNDINAYEPMCRPCHRRFDADAITHCPKGHPYAGDNLLVDAGKRKCKTCVYARNRARPLSPASKARAAEMQRRRRALKRAAA